MEDSLKKRYSIKLLGNIIAGLVNVILIAIVPKALGPVVFGEFSYLQQFFSRIIAFLDASTSVAFFTKLSAKHERKELVTFYFIFSFLLLIILYMFVFSIDLFKYTNYFLPDIPVKYIYLGLWFGFFSWLTQVYIKISDAHALTVSVEVLKILHKIITLFLLLFVIHYTIFDLSTYFYFNYFSLLSFLMIITILFIKKNIFNKNILSIKIEYKKLINEFYKFSSPLFIFNTSSLAIGLFDIWLLQKMSGSVQTGFYGLAYSIAAMCFLFTSAMTPIITREFSKSFASNDIENVRKLFKRYIPMLYSIAAYFGVFIAFQSQSLIEIFADEKFKDAYAVLTIMAFYPIHQTYGQLSGSLFFAMEETKIYSKIGIISSFLGLILSYIFIVYLNLGAMGFAWKMVIIQIISVNVQLYFNTKLLNIKTLSFVKHQIYAILFFVILAFSTTFVPEITHSNIVNFLLKGFIYTTLVIIGGFIMPSIFSINRSELYMIMITLKQKLTKE